MKKTEDLDDYIEILEAEKEILIKDIQKLKNQISALDPNKPKQNKQKGLFNLESGFVELIAYEVDDILCVGEKPYSMFNQDDIVCELRNNGVTTIINLMDKYEFNMYNQEAIKQEFNIVNIPLWSRGNESAHSEVLNEIFHIIDSNQKTYINCDTELERSDIIIGYYLNTKYAYTGLSVIQKIEELKSRSNLINTKSQMTKKRIEYFLSAWM